MSVSVEKKVIWVLNKELDVSTSRSSRLQMSAALIRIGYQVRILARFRNTPQKFGSSVQITYVPHLPFRLGRAIAFYLLLQFYLIYHIVFLRKSAVILDRHLLVIGALPAILISKLLKPSSKWILDLRSPPLPKKGFIGFLWNNSYKLSLRLSAKFLDGWTTITPILKEELHLKGKIPKDKICIWSSGVNINIFDQFAAKNPVYWLEDDKYAIFYHGAISTSRDLRETIEAVKIVKEKIKNIHFFLLGNGPDKDQLLEFVEKIGMREYVTFYPSVPYEDVPSFIAKAQLTIVPAPNTYWYQVSSPLKLMEYISMAKPVIASDIAANRSVLSESSDVIFFRCNSSAEPIEIAKAIFSAYEKWGPDFNYSSKNREIAVQKFDWTIQAEALKNYLDSLVDK